MLFYGRGFTLRSVLIALKKFSGGGGGGWWWWWWWWWKCTVTYNECDDSNSISNGIMAMCLYVMRQYRSRLLWFSFILEKQLLLFCFISADCVFACECVYCVGFLFLDLSSSQVHIRIPKIHKTHQHIHIDTIELFLFGWRYIFIVRDEFLLCLG